jgi:hypothetical protein
MNLHHSRYFVGVAETVAFHESCGVRSCFTAWTEPIDQGAGEGGGRPFARAYEVKRSSDKGWETLLDRSQADSGAN